MASRTLSFVYLPIHLVCLLDPLTKIQQLHLLHIVSLALCPPVFFPQLKLPLCISRVYHPFLYLQSSYTKGEIHRHSVCGRHFVALSNYTLANIKRRSTDHSTFFWGKKKGEPAFPLLYSQGKIMSKKCLE